MTQLEVSRRLGRYVQNAARLNGRTSVDLVFLRRFVHTSGVPWEWAVIAWQRIKKIRGFRLKWRGVGRGRRLVVAMPYFPTRSSISFGNEDRKQSPPGGVISRRESERRFASPENRDHAGTAARDNPGALPPPAGSALRCASPWRRERAGEAARGDRGARATPSPLPPPPGGGEPPEPGNRDDGGAGRAGSGVAVPPRGPVGNYRGPPAFEVAGRWVSGKKTEKMAAWLACVPMRAIHVPAIRVYWRFAHTRNFAFAAMRDGYAVPAILEAWRAAVARGHEDACDADLQRRPVPNGEAPKREPSAAVCYAWQSLRSDGLTRDQRWEKIFASPRSAQPAIRAEGIPARVKGGARPKSFARVAPWQTAAGKERARTLEDFLASKGLALASFLQLPRAEKDALFAEAFARQRGK